MEQYPKHIFLTGATGFLGKVVLEKVLRSLPSDVKVYVLIRTKAGLSGSQRLEQELFASPVFDRLKKEKGLNDRKTFLQFMHARVIAIEGDVSLKGLGISEQVMNNVLRPNIQLAIHSAASVDFDERLDLAIGNNIHGALETLETCSTFPRLKRIVHVSTAYVAVNQTHRKPLAEKVNALSFDYESLVQKALSLKNDLKELEIFTQKVLADNKFPNTYTITKAIAEVLIEQKYGNQDRFTVHIVRPSIVGAAWREPFPGWVDAISAATAVFWSAGMGIVSIILGDPRGVADLVPVDIAANHILVAGIEAQDVPIRVSHCCSSTENPVRWRVVHGSMWQSAQKIGLPTNRLFTLRHFTMFSDPTLFKAGWAMAYDAPAALVKGVATVTRNPLHFKGAELLGMLSEKAGKIAELFTPFTMNEYFFSTETSMTQWMVRQQNGEPLFKELNIDIKDLAWSQYFYNYTYGIFRFILHEDVIPVTDINLNHNDIKLNTERLITWDADHHIISFPGLLPDITWAYTQSRAPGYTKNGVFGRFLGMTGWREGLNHEAKHVPRKTIRSFQEMARLVLTSDGVVRAIKDEAARNAVKQSGKQTRRTTGEGQETNPLKLARVAARARADKVFEKMASTLEDQPPRAFGWFLRKIWRRLYEGIQVDEAGMDRLRALCMENNTLKPGQKCRPVVLLPSHRSYIDFLVLSYVMFAYNIPVPHIAASEDFLNMGPVSNLLRGSGAFFIRRDGAKSTEDGIYHEILREYLFRLLEDGQIIEFFIEGTRSRSGKSLPPKSGMMKMIAEAISMGRVEDALLVPISISYERPLEVSLYAEEMLGSSKPRETILNLLRGGSALGKKFGKIYLNFAQPVSLNQLKATSHITSPIELKLVRAIEDASACFTTHLVATLLLMYRHGASFEQLLRGCEFMRGEVYKRGGRVIGVEGMRPESVLTRALHLLGSLVAKRDVPALYQVDWSPRNWTNFLALSYYRNHLVHLFCDEAMWAAAIHARSRVADAGSSNDLSKMFVVEHNGSAKPAAKINGRIPAAPEAPSIVVLATQEELQEDVEFLHKLLARELVSTKINDPRGALGDLERRGVVQVDCRNQTVGVRESKSFALLCSIVWPLIDGYFIAATSLFALLNGAAVPVNELSSRMLALAENLFVDGVVMHYESCSSGTLSNSLETFKEWGIIKYQKIALPKVQLAPQKFRTDVSLTPEFDSRDALRALVGKIDRLRKQGHREFSVDLAGTPFGVAHLPVLAKM